ncbi:hypothetical protein IU479_35535 [Nocardia abscessus]|uniref:hypothetical protein n=1 Tax=Nocardia TaxID=1817 RepID=UPI00189491BF|nr:MULTISPECIES: hypothetical protein [Nocardia]MBF6223383.1 hypothetical protein [Nocardia abscessus]
MADYVAANHDDEFLEDGDHLGRTPPTSEPTKCVGRDESVAAEDGAGGSSLSSSVMDHMRT